VLYARRATAPSGSWCSTSILWLPAGGYVAWLALAEAVGARARVPFVWMLPVILGFTAVTVATAARPACDTGLLSPRWLSGFLVAVNAAQVIRLLFGHVEPVRALVPLVLSSGFVALVSHVAWLAATRRQAAQSSDSARYDRSTLDAARAGALLARVDTALTEGRLFVRQELTLGQLAEAAGCTPHQLSEALNRHGRTSFRDLLQRRRVEEAKALLLEADSERFTIEGIGVSAGFRSRSALYTAFRRLEGITPVEYRAARRKRGGTVDGYVQP
jgi:AraC-like DNA-binding protein